MLLLIALFSIALSKYTPSGALTYADKWWNGANHDCKNSYLTCSTWAYFGGDHCGYPSHGGDCANFVSQCLNAGGHSPLVGFPQCRGYPCGKEEPGAKNLDDCLANHFGWTRQCGLRAKPPAGIQPGDVAIYHKASCSDFVAHATIVTVVNNSNTYVSCHSPSTHNGAYTRFFSSHPCVSWLLLSSYSSLLQ